MQPFLIVKHTDLIFDLQSDFNTIQTYLVVLQQSIAEKRACVYRNAHC